MKKVIISIMNVLKIIAAILPPQKAYAHCDVPCGIYDPKPAQIAAATVLKMVQKIQDLDHPPKDDVAKHDNYMNSLVRYIWTKEEHARKCKEEILILWTDYFKPEHLEKFPQLHEIFWKTAKLCSSNKQEVSLEHAQELVKAVDEIADIFHQTKQAK
jgi:nickel superoxide dismutase